MLTALAITRRVASLGLLLLAVSFGIYLAVLANLPGFSADYLLNSYGTYLGALARGDLGQTGRLEPVGALILRTFFKSFGVLALATAVSAVVGVGIGVVGLSRGRGVGTSWPLAVSVVLLSLPGFLVGAILQGLDVQIAIRVGTLPLPLTGFGWDRHLVMPVLVLAAKPTAYVARVTVQMLEETLSQHHIRTAYAKGLTTRAVLLCHSIPSTAASLLAAAALGMRVSLGGLPIVEIVFAYPGMGFAFLMAIRDGDAPAAAGLGLTLALALWSLNALIDLARWRVDPRLRARDGTTVVD